MLNWFLIAMMVMLPLRSVLAFDQTSCQMQHETPRMMVDHSSHMMPDDVQGNPDKAHNCCSESGAACNNNCSSGMNLSFVFQKPVLITANYNSMLVANTSNDVLFRATTPPIRPPAYLQS